ncbi:MAG: VCBS repeat-containing protein, partial [Bacteroidota bacterium]
GDAGFVNVSDSAGILIEGWGLGVGIVDINEDGWPDIYVANDFLTNDILYVNQQDGTFKDEVATYFQHQSYNSMGIDIADLNNDAQPDLMVLDMMPEDNRRQKSMFAAPNYDRFQRTLRTGYQPQFVRNVLQLNRGNGRFSEIGQLAGVFQTDWSWTPLMIDLDNDGLRDILITNGYHRDVTDMDYVAYTNGAMMFGDQAAKREKMRLAIEELEGVKKHNYLYHNQGGLHFADRSAEWGFDEISYSNGAAFADFDQDGDLDIVINNINDPAFLYENHTIDAASNNLDSPHYLRLRLRGKDPNPNAQGARLWLQHKVEGITHTLFEEHNRYRGYKSSVEPIVHFGLGKATKVEKLKVQWPDGFVEHFAISLIDTVLIIEQGKGSPGIERSRPNVRPLFTEQSWEDWIHPESEYNDFLFESLLMHKYSQSGPGLAVGDLDGDGQEELWVGGSARQSAQIWRYRDGQGWQREDFMAQDAAFEDMGGLWFDADGDGDQDLYVVSGSNEFSRGDTLYQDRLYFNDGKGNLVRDKTALPNLPVSGGQVSAADVDRDGDLDLLVAGALLPRKYPLAGQTLLLINEGGRFAERSSELAAGLADIGMLKAALWTDVDGDDWPDLLLAGEWMPLCWFRNENGKLIRQETAAFANTEGWWNSLTGADFDQDGDIDYIAGNLGLNTRYKASPEQPVCVYVKDFDGNGQIDPILCHFLQGTEYVVHPRDQLSKQMTSMRSRFNSYYEYGLTPFSEMLSKEEKQDMQRLEAHYFSSSYLENLGQGEFAVRPLAVEAQFAPIYGIQTGDYNRDGFRDIALVGNSYANNSQHGFHDASLGSIGLGDGKGHFDFVAPARSGLLVDGDAKALVELGVPRSGPLLIASQNQGPLKVYQQEKTQSFPLDPSTVKVKLRFEDGRLETVECYRGHGYLSQSSRSVVLPEGLRKIDQYDQHGQHVKKEGENAN